MSYEFRLQDPGEGIHEAEIVEIAVAKGDRVAAGDDVLVAETDKAAVDIPSPVSGEIIELNVSQGDVVEVGDVLMVLEEDSEHAADESSDAKADVERADDSEIDQDEAEPEEAESEEKQTQQKDTDEAAGELPKSSDSRPTDSGSDKAARTKASRASDDGGTTDKKVLATPAVRGLARELGVELATISGSGEVGRILKKDIRAAVNGDAAAETDTSDAEPSEDAEGERIPLRSIRRATAKRIARSWREIPHVVHFDEIDITALERLRRDHNQEASADVPKLTATPFIVKALAGALGEFPRFNARLDNENEEILLLDDVHVGVAIDTDRGLLVPVLRNADRKSVVELAGELENLSNEVRGDRIKSDILKGATFTLTNVGAIGGTSFSPIINPPQVAIFGAARAGLRQVVRGDIDDPEVDVALVLPVCIAFDHRVVDGADAARFMNAVKDRLGDPAEFLMRT